MANKISLKTFLASTSLMTVMTTSALANTTKELERVMVIGGQDKVAEITGSAHYVGEEELDKYNYNDINRVLRQVPGVTIQEEEGYGNRPNIGIRGGRSERSADITLMEDGVLIAPAPYSAPAAYYFPRVDRMEAVEVRKGSSTIKFGPRTTSGAVNLVSSSIPAQSEGKALLAYGDDNTQRAQLNYGNTHGRFGYVIDLGHEATDGFKSIDAVGGDTGFSIQDVMAKFRVTSDPNAEIYQHIEFKVGATEEDSDETYLGLSQADFDADPFRRYAASQVDNMDADHQQFQIRHYIEPTDNWDITTTAYRNQFARNWYKLQSVEIGGATLGTADAIDSAAYLAALKGQTDLAGDANNNLAVRANNRDYVSQGIQTNVGHQFDYGKTSHDIEFGIRYHYDEEDRFQHQDLYSITGGVMSLTSAGAPGSNANRVGSAHATALFIEDEIKYENWTIVPGIRYEHIELKRENRANGQVHENDLDVVVPGIGIAYQINDATSVFGGVHKGFAPPGPSTNTSQDPEESINYEFGVRFTENAFKTEAVAFYNDYDNLLGEETLSGGGGTGTGEQFNGGQVDVYGVEIGLEYDFSALLDDSKYKFPVGIGYTYTKAEFGSSFDSAFDEWGSVTDGDELPYVPEHQVYISAGVEAEKWALNASAKYVDEMRTVAGSGSIPSGSGTDEHIILDIAGEYEVYKNTRVFATLHNVTDEEYVAARRPAGARPGAPRTLLAGLKLKF
ncbi:MAG: TonB-dependent receptor [Rickettsiales bacterium]|nr:TonB-dependent receptor [Pseudomonadota bacterium]MDA0966239.1 TonB-dependent receptor [Pseudomonadota bacterium]MDG4543096.1 TonB-dependent receptor [Rickettsiales bacterium]MDG4545294.1 TonB-dependent receptor [Rickettsiales bacterium]MDG4547743.1 TonB-dependent receptor [Rickettsiales bacterium]